MSRDRVSAFVAEHGDGLLRFAFLLTGGRCAEAEDLVQTVLLRMLERDLSGVGSLGAYARRALVNEQHSRGRRESVGRRVLHRLWRPDSATDPDVVDRVAVLEALRALGDRERAAVVLRYWEDLPDEEIAEVLGCASATVRSLVHRALPRLRAAIGDPDGPDASTPTTRKPQL